MTNWTDSQLIQEAAKLIRARNFQDALNLLIPYIEQNPQSEDGWFLLSFAVREPQQKLECLQRVIELNPNHTRARERLAKLKKVAHAQSLQTTPPPQEAAPRKRRGKGTRRRKATVPILIFLLISVIAIGYFGSQYLFPDLSPLQRLSVANQPSVIPTFTPQPLPTQTAVPTKPAATATASPTLTSSPTAIPPTPTRIYASPQDSLAQQMDDIQNQVSTIRDLGILIDNPRYIIPSSKVVGLLSDVTLDRYTRAQITDEGRVLVALGLIPPGYDLFTTILNNFEAGLGGFYLPEYDELFITGNELEVEGKLAYAHEYLHALVDQHFQIENMVGYPECIEATDRCQAITALIEGDATHLMYKWLEAYASEDEIAEIAVSEYSPLDQALNTNILPPPYVIRSLYFKYFDGKLFVENIFDMGGWPQVSLAYRNLPQSTEQILHPEKYMSREEPTQIDLKSLDQILDEDWRHLKTGTLGELTTQMVLGSNANHLVQLDPIKAAQAAAGWAGDSYQVYYQSNSNQTILVAQWDWDSQEDSQEFWQAMQEYLNRRYAGRKVEDIPDECWTKINDHFSCVYRTSRSTLWLMAPNMASINLLLEQYPKFLRGE